MTFGRVTAAYDTSWFRHAARVDHRGAFPHPHHHSVLSRPVPSIRGLSLQKRRRPRNSRTFLGARLQTLTASVTANPLLSCFLPCQILPVSNQRQQDLSYVKFPQGLYGTGQNPTLGLLACVRCGRAATVRPHSFLFPQGQPTEHNFRLSTRRWTASITRHGRGACIFMQICGHKVLFRAHWALQLMQRESRLAMEGSQMCGGGNHKIGTSRSRL